MENLNKEQEVEKIPLKSYKVLGVSFEVTKKRYYFEVTTNEEYKKGDKVIVDTIRGQELGIVYARPMLVSEDRLYLPLKPVLKKATESEIQQYNNLRAKAIEARKIFKERIKFHKLDMKVVETEYTLDSTKLIFYFVSECRVDFRELVKDLANIFRVRIELRQIGVRDEARILGTIGVCGKELCCRAFINTFESVSIKMARDQGLVINPAKISGVCGRLLCCLGYEYEQYEKVLKYFPAVNQQVKTENGNGRVVSISPLSEQLFVDIEGKGIMKFRIHDIKFNKKEANKLKTVENKEDIEHKDLEKD